MQASSLCAGPKTEKLNNYRVDRVDRVNRDVVGFRPEGVPATLMGSQVCPRKAMNYGPTDPKASKAVSRGECGVSHGDAAPAIKEKEATESGECDVPHGDVASATKKEQLQRP